jgi:hypothetical protein
MVLENVLTAILLPIISFIATIGISYLWKRYTIKKEEKPAEQQPPGPVP